jgi:hypothetical protein
MKTLTHGYLFVAFNLLEPIKNIGGKEEKISRTARSFVIKEGKDLYLP